MRRKLVISELGAGICSGRLAGSRHLLQIGKRSLAEKLAHPQSSPAMARCQAPDNYYII
jgi:hypothetical protein